MNAAFGVTPADGFEPTSAPTGSARFKRFPAGTPLDSVRRWRMDTRVALDLTKRAAGTLAGDVEPFLRQIADRPRLVAERRQQLEWWAARLGHLRRHAITPSDVRAALAELRQTLAASTCNHYRQALFSLYKTLDGRDAPNPLRDVAPFPNPAPRLVRRRRARRRDQSRQDGDFLDPEGCKPADVWHHCGNHESAMVPQ